MAVHIENIKDQDNYEGNDVSLQITAKDAGQTVSSGFTATGLPAGLTISDAGLVSGAITAGTVTTGNSREYSVSVTVNYNSTTATQSFKWNAHKMTAAAPSAQSHSNGTVIAADGKTTPPGGTATPGTPIQVTTTKPEGHNLSFEDDGTLPQGLSIGSNGVISGTLNEFGVYDITKTVEITVRSEGGGDSIATKVSFDWAIDFPGPDIQAPDPQSSNEGATAAVASPFLQIKDSNNAALTGCTFAAENLPPGLSIDNDGKITGTIDRRTSLESPFNVTVEATNAQGYTSEITFSWTVVDINVGPTITAPANQTQQVGDNLSLQIVAQDADSQNEELKYEAYNLPPGLTIDGDTGLISGIAESGADANSPYSVTILVRDKWGKETEQTFDWAVSPAQGPDLKNPGIQQSEDSAGESLQVTDSSGNTLSNTTFSAAGLPAGLSINASTGEITGTISASASGSSPYKVIVTATDNSTQQSTDAAFTWYVDPIPVAPPPPPAPVTPGLPLNSIIQVKEQPNYHFLCGIDADNSVNYDPETQAVDLDYRTFDVIDFEGTGAISELHATTINLVSRDPNIDFSNIVNRPAKLLLKRGGTWDFADPTPTTVALPDRAIYGIISDFQATGRSIRSGTPLYYYQARLVPKLWKLSLSKQSRVFQIRSVPNIIRDVLAGYLDGAPTPANEFIENTNYEFRLADATVYYDRDYCVQYKESDLEFISRLMEYEGLYFFFEYDAGIGQERLVITDYSEGEADMQTVTDIDAATGAYEAEEMTNDRAEIAFRMMEGMTHAEENVVDLIYHEKMMPGQLAVKDYNYEDFHDLLPKTESVDASMPGVYQEYDKYYKKERPYVKTGAKDEGDTIQSDQSLEDFAQERIRQVYRLAEVRREELQCQRRIANGRGDCMGFEVGYRFVLTYHYRESLNRDYLLTTIRHIGSQISTLTHVLAGIVPVAANELTRAFMDDKAVGSYVNEFTCIPATEQFRPKRQTPIPQMSGILTAKVERRDSISEDMADVDSEGRYKIRLPFDQRTSDTTPSGEASKRVRLAQPYSGTNFGIHFPNYEGTEMVFACVDGNIDHPVALGTVPHWGNHAPSPSDGLSLPGENSPKGMGAAAVPFGEGISDSNQASKMFPSSKNVIQTKRGHRLVMDDADGTGNIGVTLQTGVGEWPEGSGTINTGTANTYWYSRIDMGGYRKKSFFEQFLDSASHVLSMLKLVALNPSVPDLAAIVSEIIASQVASGNYAADTMGDTTPNGISILTDQGVMVMGANGVTLNMPNILGAWGAGTIPGLGPGQHRVSRAIVSFMVNFLYQDTIQALIDKKKEMKELHEGNEVLGFPEFDEERKNWFKSWLAYEDDKLLGYASGILHAALGLPAINLNSVANVNVAAFGKTSIMGGYNGIELNSKAHLKASADLDLNIEAGQGIVIKTKGKPVGSPGFFGIWPRLANALPILKLIPAPFGKSAKPGTDKCHITILNENQDVRTFAFEGNIEQRAKKDVFNTSVDGNFWASAPNGDIDLFNDHGRISLLHGQDDKKKSTASIASLGRLTLTAAGGKASIVLHDNGNVDIIGEELSFNGKKITVKGGNELHLESKKTTVAAVPAPPVPAPQPPQPPNVISVPIPPSEPVPVLPKSDSPQELKRVAAINAENQRAFAGQMHYYGMHEAAYKAYVTQLEAYYKQVAQHGQVAGSPTASIILDSAPGKIDVKATTDLKMDSLNYENKAKINQKFDAVMVDTKASGIVKTQGSLVKIN